jgi:hypothetical protein
MNRAIPHAPFRQLDAFDAKYGVTMARSIHNSVSKRKNPPGRHRAGSSDQE